MNAHTDTTGNPEKLTQKRCLPCEGGVEACSIDASRNFLSQVEGWSLTADQKRIRRDWKFKNFVEALDFLNKVGAIAESEAHHPDLHLESYRHVWIEIWTHAVGGLTENDFILAAKINEISA
jgi:4a-hydroxytetrahydrobiopterin dehydratase